MAHNMITIRGARQHNLKNIDVDIPRDRLVVITGVSGSGKSTLAFDTIFAEGQRRYVESLSAYAQQILGRLDRPEVDLIDGLSPAIAIDQKTVARNPRSTVGTITEIYDVLRLLFARCGRPHCPHCGRPLARHSVQQMVDAVLALPPGSRVLLLAPLARERRGDLTPLLDEARRAGFVRVQIDGAVVDLSDVAATADRRAHDLDVVVDRLVVRAADPAAETPERVRVTDSVETALKAGGGVLIAQIVAGAAHTFSQQYRCPEHGLVGVGALEPRDFSFNTPAGACQTCDGLGTVHEIDPDLVLPDRGLPLDAAALAPWADLSPARRRVADTLLAGLVAHSGARAGSVVRDLPTELVALVLYGSNGEPLPLQMLVKNVVQVRDEPFEGVIPELRRRLAAAKTDEERGAVEQYTTIRSCPACGGARLRPELLAVTVTGESIGSVAARTAAAALQWADSLLDEAAGLTPRELLIARPIAAELRGRLQFLVEVGLPYMTLDRAATTLSGGEAQRIRLATQIGTGISGVLYILDEPSIGLHPHDHSRLLGTIHQLRDRGNSVIVVEHDEETIRAADWLIDIGPGAGDAGGELLASGPIATIMAAPRSITGDYLAGRRAIITPTRRRGGNGKTLQIIGARAHNLRGITVSLPLGALTAVTGVSGSGKSTLVNDTLLAYLLRRLHGAKLRPGAHDAVLGSEHLDKVIAIDQAPLGRTPRSNPATAARVFDPIRQLFAATNEARVRGYDAGRFSFNVVGGRCEHCRGEGVMQIEMQFLPNLYVPCEVCGGARYNRETLDIRYRGRTIADVLAMTAAEAATFFERVPQVAERLTALVDVGVGYLRLGQPATTLSGGEAQRIRLASELGRRATGRTLYVFDEPTTGLHFADVARLIAVIQRLVDAGNTAIVIEHNLDVIRCADYIIDMGPDGGVGGGTVVASGTPEQVAGVAGSYTGRYLRAALGSDRVTG